VVKTTIEKVVRERSAKHFASLEQLGGREQTPTPRRVMSPIFQRELLKSAKELERGGRYQRALKWNTRKKMMSMAAALTLGFGLGYLARPSLFLSGPIVNHVEETSASQSSPELRPSMGQSREDRSEIQKSVPQAKALLKKLPVADIGPLADLDGAKLVGIFRSAPRGGVSKLVGKSGATYEIRLRNSYAANDQSVCREGLLTESESTPTRLILGCAERNGDWSNARFFMYVGR
jgi:hypothetical protein